MDALDTVLKPVLVRPSAWDKPDSGSDFVSRNGGRMVAMLVGREALFRAPDTSFGRSRLHSALAPRPPAAGAWPRFISASLDRTSGPDARSAPHGYGRLESATAV